MKSFCFFICIGIVLHALSSLALDEPVPVPQPVTKDLYRIFEGNGPGEFNNEEAEWLAHYVYESSIMAKAGLNAIINYQTDVAARKHVASFFGVHPNAQQDGTFRPDDLSIRIIRAFMVDVNDYLNNRQGSPSNKPLLPLIFSGDAWLVKQSWDDVVIDGSTNKPSSSGKKLKEVYAELYDTVTKPDDNKSESSDENDDDNDHDDQEQGDSGEGSVSDDQNSEPERDPPRKYLYWSDKLRDYFSDQDYGPGKGLCSAPGNKAASNKRVPEYLITTICRNNIQSPNPVIGNQVPPPNLGKDIAGKDVVWRRRTTLADKVPQSLSVLHEFFHYVDMKNTYPDVSSNQGSLDAIRANAKGKPETQEKNLRDPETLAYFCAASWFSQQEYGEQKDHFEFSLGSANLVPKT